MSDEERAAIQIMTQYNGYLDDISKLRLVMTLTMYTTGRCNLPLSYVSGLSHPEFAKLYEKVCG